MTTLRCATADDIPFIMQTERLPGYDLVVGRFEEAEHHARIADPAWAYLVGDDGFAILNDLDNRDGNVCLKRFAVTERGRGLGSRLMPLVVDWSFTHTPVHRLWLNLIEGNEAAWRLYERSGFLKEGVRREAAVLPDGRRSNMIMMSILRPEWDARQRG